MNRFEIAKKLKKKKIKIRASYLDPRLAAVRIILKSRTEGSPDFKHRGVK